MAITAAAVKAALAALTDEQARKTVGWIAAAVLAPIILIAALLLSLLSGTTQHNNAAVDLVFNGGVVPSSMSAEYAAQVRVMQTCLEELDSAVAEVNDQMESGSLDGNWVKAVFFSLCFWDEHLKLTPSEARDFADCFVRYEERTRTVASGTDPDTGETIYTEETYTVAVPVDQEIAFNNLDAAGYPITEDLVVNAQAVYDRIAYGAADGYTGEIQYGSSRITELDTSDFTAPTTKNAEDLVAYVTHAWESGWGYVWGTYGNVLTESLLTYKVSQYPDGVGNHEDIIRANWLGGRTTDCVGLIKGYSWLNAETMEIQYGTHGMPDIGANQMYYNARESGPISTMPDIPGLAVWHDGHIGVYIGNGQVIEAMGTRYGVVKTELADRGWTHWLKVPYINYD